MILDPTQGFLVRLGGGPMEVVPFEDGAELVPSYLEMVAGLNRESTEDDVAFVALMTSDDEDTIHRRSTQISVQLAGLQGFPYNHPGRNAPCPCGSGKKFKLCHGQ